MLKLLQFQDDVITKARDIFKQSDDLHMASFPNVKPTEFAEGTYVLVKYRNRQGTAPTRLHTQWKGPLRVIGNDKSEYLLLDLINNKEKPYHACLTLLVRILWISPEKTI